jgi:myo-inositol-1(or 4)-monophosphatase
VSVYNDLLAVACDAVDAAREIFLTRSPGSLTAKGDRDMASEVDYAIERRLAALLEEKTPTLGFLGEEGSDRSAAAELRWTLDPVDGTVNFVHGSPLCGISLGLLRGSTPVLGVVDLPLLGLRYTATEDGGAYRDGRRLAVSEVATLDEAVVAIGDYAVGVNAVEKNRTRLAITERLAASAQRVRMHGSAAIDLAWLAEGRIDGVAIMSNKPWDTAAGAIIAREAGARIVDVDGSPHTSASRATIAANPALLPDLLKMITDVESPAGERLDRLRSPGGAS